MRRITWTAAILLCFSLVIAACGTKDAESVVKELDKVVNKMESYQASGQMILHTGPQNLTYDVEVSYMKPQYYRIKLTNAEKDITQIVLRNDDGVFVLTPRLNKVFRFQSEWPQNQGQVYLYQTLAQSILVDNSRQFTVDENKDAYVFDVMANYNNGTLARQKIWLDKGDYHPVHVEVSDTNASVMVEVNFTTFDFDAKLDKSAFETEANMKSSPSTGSQTNDQPTAASPEGDDSAITDDSGNEGNTDANGGNAEEQAGSEDQGDKASGEAGAEDPNSETDASADPETNAAADPEADAETGAAADVFAVMVPSYTPEGVTLKDELDIVFGGNPGMMTRYTGAYDYTLIQTQPDDLAASAMKGDGVMGVDLGFTYGELMTGSEQQTLTWTYEGSVFRLTSATLPESEMIKIAQSVQGEAGKP